MKKIPTLFKRVFENGKIVNILPEVTKGFEWVIAGEGTATVKYDGSCCAVFDGELYKRYDAKQGKTPPEGAIPCCEPDPITGHHPHWVKCSRDDPNDKWFLNAFDTYTMVKFVDTNILTFSLSLLTPHIEHNSNGTYEAIGKHFNGNPYGLTGDILVPHGTNVINKLDCDRTFEGIKKYLTEHDDIEGIVFWKDGEPQCKIKRTDFGLPWNNK